MRHFHAVLMLIVLLFVSAVDAFADSYSGGDIYYPPEKIIAFAKKFERSLAAKGARVAIVARVGRPRDKLPEGVMYTHTGFAVYSLIKTADGRELPGYAMYNLYQREDKPDVSDLVQDYPVDFFSGVQVLEAGVIIPTPELQRRLLDVIASPTYKKLHSPAYSVIANPFNTKFQNCTEHTLDVIFAAIYQTDDIASIKANEKAYYEAHKLDINPIKLALGSMFMSDVKTADQDGQPVTATFPSIQRFLQKFTATTDAYALLPD